MTHMAENTEREARTEATKETISRVRKLLHRVHSDKAGGGTEQLVPILNEILKFPNDLEGWSDEMHTQYPKGSEVVFAGLAKDGTLREPKSFPLRRPEVFLKMVEEFLNTGDVSPELVADDAEGDHEESEEK